MSAAAFLLVDEIPRLRFRRHPTAASKHGCSNEHAATRGTTSTRMHACLHARHKAVPARGTVWVICVRSVEHQRVGRKLVDIGRVHIVSVAVRLELRPQIVADEQQDILPAGLVISGRAAASKQPRVSYAKLAHSWPRVLQHVSRLAPGAGKELLCQQPTALERGARARASPRVYTRVHGPRPRVRGTPLELAPPARARARVVDLRLPRARSPNFITADQLQPLVHQRERPPSSAPRTYLAPVSSA